MRVVFTSGDRDWVPDEIEPTLCDVEDPRTVADGACTSGDYERPTLTGIASILP